MGSVVKALSGISMCHDRNHLWVQRKFEIISVWSHAHELLHLHPCVIWMHKASIWTCTHACIPVFIIRLINYSPVQDMSWWYWVPWTTGVACMDACLDELAGMKTNPRGETLTLQMFKTWNSLWRWELWRWEIASSIQQLERLDLVRFERDGNRINVCSSANLETPGLDGRKYHHRCCICRKTGLHLELVSS